MSFTPSLAPKAPSTTQLEPTSLIFYGAPKCGKSTILAHLAGCYTLVCDPNGMRYVSQPCAYDYINTWQDMDAAVTFLEALPPVERPKYYGVDTADGLEALAAEKGLATYLKRFPGQAKSVPDVLAFQDLPHGTAWGYIRSEFKRWTDRLGALGTLVMTGHVRPKAIAKEIMEASATDLALTGKLALAVAGSVDVIAFARRDDKDNVVLSTKSVGKAAVNCGSRVPWLADREWVISRSTKGGPVVDWSTIFPSLRSDKVAAVGTQPA